MKVNLFFIVFSLIVIVSGSITGCKPLQPVTITKETVTNSGTLKIDNPEYLRKLFECDSNNQVAWNYFALQTMINDSLYRAYDSLLNANKEKIVKNGDTVFIVKYIPADLQLKEQLKIFFESNFQKVDTVYSNPKLVYVDKPLTWWQNIQLYGFWVMLFNFILVILLLIKFKK